MAKEDPKYPSMWTQEDREWFESLRLADFRDQPSTQKTIAVKDLENAAPVDDFIEVEDITPELEKLKLFPKLSYKLHAGITPFELHVRNKATELGWDGGNNIKFSPESLHSLIFEKLPIITGNKDSVDSLPDGFNQAQVQYLRRGQTVYDKLNLADEKEKEAYQNLMSDLGGVTNIQYDVFSRGKEKYLYSFNMQNKAHAIDNSRMVMILPKDIEWTDSVTLWALTQHRIGPSPIHYSTAAPLANRINSLVAQSTH